MKTLQTITEGKVVVASDTLAVPAHFFVDEGVEHGSILEHEISPDLMKTLASFRVGDEVFFQSPDEMDCVDDENRYAAAATRQWFLGTILAESGTGGPR